MTAAPTPPIDVLRDAEAGTFTGAEAEKLRREAEWVRSHGGAEYVPTGLCGAADPLRDAATLAILFLCLGYCVPELLKPALRGLVEAQPEDPLPPSDAVY